MNTFAKQSCALSVFLLAAWNCLGSSYVIDWTYEYGVSSAGKKSESVYGRLLYKGDELPMECQHVITPIGEFVYIDGQGEGSKNKIAWVPLGKLPGYTDEAAHAAGTEAEVEELLTGNVPIFRRVILNHAPAAGTEACMAGPFDKPPAGVGKDWFYVVGKSLWVNPREIEEVAREKLGAAAAVQVKE